MGNVVTLGIGMSLTLIGMKVSSSFIVPILGNLGSIAMALMYFSNSFANFFVPPILNLFKNERTTMFYMVFEYGLYILEFAYIIPPITLVWSFIHGIVAAVLWTAEGIYLCANSNDSDRGKKSGIFWTLYMTGAALGNIAVFFLLKKIGLSNYTNSSGWHDGASIMFIFLGCASLLGAIPMRLLKPSASEDPNRKYVAKTSPKVLMKKMIRLIVSPSMRWLLLPMFYVGFEYVFIGSMLTRQVHNTGNVGLMMSLFCIIEMVVSTPLGLLLDRVGTISMFTLSCVFEFIAILVFWYANKTQGGLFYLAFIFLSLADSSFETVLPTVIGHNYTDLESANSTYRLFQYMGSCVCYLIAPLFVDQSTSWVSDANLLREMILCAGLGVVSLVFFIIYSYGQKKTLPVQPKEEKKVAVVVDSKKEIMHVGNEDLEELSKEGGKVAAAESKDVKTVAKSNEEFHH